MPFGKRKRQKRIRQGSIMIPSLFDGTTIPVLEQVVNFSQARQNVLASNIANLDTPGYRTRDLSPELFQKRLRDALVQRDRHPERVAGLDGALAGASSRRNSLSDAGKNLAGILRHDDSNVAVEQQVAAAAKNQLQHNLAVTIMSSQFRLLQTAISERV